MPERRELSWAEVAGLPWIWVENLPFFSVLQQKLGDNRVLANKAAIAVDEQIVRELVMAGQGVAIMREDEARPLVERGLVTIWDKGWGEIPSAWDGCCAIENRSVSEPPEMWSSMSGESRILLQGGSMSDDRL